MAPRWYTVPSACLLIVGKPRAYAVTIPSLTRIRQTAPQPVVQNLAETVRQQWLNSRALSCIKPGDRVALGVGSRGIANLHTMVRATLDVLLERQAQPFVVAAMGSHGGATSQGQRELLAEYRISEAVLGVPVVTDMDVDRIGTNSWKEPVYWDRRALNADHVLTISRIKPHTDFRSKIESGICKMLVIGLGKREGAAQHHRWGFRGLRDMLPETLKVILEKTPFRAGLAVLENAHEQTGRVQVVERDELLEVEPVLLEEARRMMARLPFDQFDLLVIGEIGKNYSGAGIDPNVVGRLLIETQPEPGTPSITRICCLDLSPESHGNGTGVGIADLTTQRLLDGIDPIPFRMNNLTACFLWRSKLPIAFPNDRECIESGIKTCWQPIPERLRLAIIPNTLELSELWVSPALAEDARQHPHLEIVDGPKEAPFDTQGNLLQETLFPHSVRGRRNKDKRS